MLSFVGFCNYVKNPLQSKLNLPLLRSNLEIVKNVDITIRNLVKTRYTNLNNYKEKIMSAIELPTYIRTLLTDYGFYTAEQLQKQNKLQQEQQAKLIKSYNPSSNLIDLILQGNSSSCSSTTTSSPFNNKQNNESNPVFTFEELKLTDFCGTNDNQQHNIDEIFTSTAATSHKLLSPRLNYKIISSSSNTPRTPNSNLNNFSILSKNNEYLDNDTDDNIWSSAVGTPNAILSPSLNKKQNIKYIKQHHLSSGTASSASPPSDNCLYPDNYNALFNANEVLQNDPQLESYVKHSPFISPPVYQRTIMNKFATDTWHHQQNNNNYTKFNNQRINFTTKQVFNNKDLFQSSPRHRHFSNIDTNSNLNNDFYINSDSSYLSSPNNANNNLFFPNEINESYAKYNNDDNKSHFIPWSGRLPPKIYPENAIYSRKVFIGGVPWDCDHNSLQNILSKYGPVKLEVPGKDQKHPRVSTLNKTHDRAAPGYIYVIYDNETAVQKMLADCRKDVKNGGEHYYYTIYVPQALNNLHQTNLNSKRTKPKEVEVVPWNQDDTSFVPEKNIVPLPQKIDAKSTIFVGGLHGMLNAQGLAKVMNELFGEVIHAGLDTDKYKYPIGSGRVTFRFKKSYI